MPEYSFVCLLPERAAFLYFKKLTITGDLAFTGILSEEPEKNKVRFGIISSELTSSDLVFANLEVPVKVDQSINEYKHFIHYSLPNPTKELLQRLNISCVSLANNHIYDCKMAGLMATIDLLDNLGIRHTGAGFLQEHIEPVIISKEGYKIGFLAYVDKATNPKTEHFPELYISYFDIDKVILDIKQLACQVDKVICSIHWGVDYSFYPTPCQRSVAREIVNAGTDIVMGHHPHTLQPYEKYNGSYIFYSLGSLTFGDFIKKGDTERQSLFRKTKRSVIANYNFHENTFDFLSTYEMQGNYVKIKPLSYEKWSKTKWQFFAVKHSSAFATKIFLFKEKILDRIYEYFFGYYKKPLKQLFQLSNIRKLKRLYHDFRQG